ncbi:SubName: Full=Uncharacterized protein {ECO:0000313/EMBL:CCA66785.1} [Serendipita indica DSM 11827]|nr:SubName: Full=Uncharacterized protein {ECO:0000313/EMBL:CCA66785.1} [Serendipita indica DSM 11827]
MANLSPQPTGTSTHLQSRNPFLGLITPQSTGPVASPPTTSPSSRPENATAPTTSTDVPRLPPRIIRSDTSGTGILNSTPTPQEEQPNEAVASPTRFAPPTAPPPSLPPRTPSSNPPANQERHSPPRSSTLDILQEDLPPAYTPGPSTNLGEQSVEFGPLRPFQNETPNPNLRRPQHGSPFGIAPGAQYIRSQRTGPTLGQALGELLVALTTPREEPRRTPGSGHRPSSFPGGSFQGPPFGPPRPNNSSQPSRQGWSQYPGMPIRATTPEAQTPPPNDGKPTARPSPGHPLLRDNHVLVYPLGYECHKCFNRGFKPVHASTFDSTPRALAAGDPSDPCRKCWRHYSRPYTAALAQLDWNNPVETNFQRPISDFTQGGPPPSRHLAPQATGGPPSTQPYLSPRSPPGGYPGNSAQRSPARAISGPSRPPPQWANTTPSGRRVVYEPGDPRIGGRLCVRCHGSGRVRVFILDSEVCSMCGGIGRVF